MTLSLIAVITVVFWASPVLARPTLPFGVRVPAARAAEPVIAQARRRYTRDVLLLGAVAFGAALLTDLRPELLVTLLAAGHCLLGYRAHRSVAAGKRAGDWYAGTRQAVTADTSLRTTPVRPQWTLLAPAVALLVVTAAIGAWRYPDLPATLPTPNGLTVDAAHRTATTVSFAFATVTAQLSGILLVAILALAIPRARPEIDAAHPAASAARYRTYLTGVLRLLLISAGCANASLLVASLQVWEIVGGTLGATIAGYLPLAAALALWVIFAVRTGDAGHRLPAEGESSRYVQRDDDRHWHVAGMVYLNRSDPAVLVHRRTGLSWTLNLGNPVSWALVAAVAAVALLAGTGVVDLPVRAG